MHKQLVPFIKFIDQQLHFEDSCLIYEMNFFDYFARGK
jgi:hypothetical protein